MRCITDEYFIRIHISVFLYFKGKSIQNPWKVCNRMLYHLLTKGKRKRKYNDLREEHSRSPNESICWTVSANKFVSIKKGLLTRVNVQEWGEGKLSFHFISSLSKEKKKNHSHTYKHTPLEVIKIFQRSWRSASEDWASDFSYFD